MKGTRLINRCPEKISFGQMGHAILGPKMVVHPHNSGPTIRNFLKILHIEKGQQIDESNNDGLYLKKFVYKWAILGSKMAYPHNSGSALRIF